MELVGLSLAADDRPLKTIMELKELRDLIAHGRPEKLSGELLHPEGAEPPYPGFALRSMFTPKEKMTRAAHDVDQFAIKFTALPRQKSAMFGSAMTAYEGPEATASETADKAKTNRGNVTRSSIPIIAALVWAFGCGTQRTHRVVVAYPEHWPEGEYRNCFLDGPGHAAGFDSGQRSDLAHLDCDRYVKGEIIHKTPPDHIYVIDVEFFGDYKLSSETSWTCRQNKASIDCRR